MLTKSVPDLAHAVHHRLKREGVPSPGSSALTNLLETVYFTSLKTEEGKPLQVRIALVDPANADPSPPRRLMPPRWKIAKLTTRLPSTVPNLVKLSKAADPWSSCLAVYFDEEGHFYIWGLIDQTVHFNTRLVRESATGYAPPGLFHIVTNGTADLSVNREYGFVARLQQDRIVSRQNDVFWFGPVSDRLAVGIDPYVDAIWRKLGEPPPSVFDYWPSTFADTWISVLCRILISIQRYRHGGALLLTNSKSNLDVKYRINYSRIPKALVNLGINRFRSNMASDEIISEYLEKDLDDMPVGLYLDETVADNDIRNYESEITGCVRFVSSLSCVDGLILSTPDLVIRGFGAEIRAKKEVETVYVSPTPRVHDKSLQQLDPSHYGMRHRSMMRYCNAYPKSVGFVVSQDGEIRAMTRVKDRLVMWENLSVLSYFEPVRKKQPVKRKKAR